MPKKMIGSAAKLLPIGMVCLVLFCAVTAGGAGTTADPIPTLATNDRTLVYVETASKLGAPWDIAMLVDAVYAVRSDSGSIEEVNPIHTALEFSLMAVSVEKYVVVSSTWDEENECWDDTYDWVHDHDETYTAKDAITAYLGIDAETLEELSADGFTELMQRTMQNRSDSRTRYSAAIHANYAVRDCLESYTTLTAEEIEKVMELYEANYLIERLEDDVREQVYDLMGDYGVYQYLDTSTYVNCEGTTFGDVIYYNQMDTRWADAAYGVGTIGKGGCGPTAMAIVLSTLTGQNYDPVFLSNWSVQHGYYYPNQGSARALIPASAAAFGVECSGCGRDSDSIKEALRRGDLVVAIMGRGHFTSRGHYIVLRGITEDGKILVADPASVRRSTQAWDLSLIVGEASRGDAAGGPFWIMRKGGDT